MPIPDPTLIAQTILEAPGWARMGITAPKEDLRFQAAEELGRAIHARLQEPTVEDGRQMPLPL